MQIRRGTIVQARRNMGRRSGTVVHGEPGNPQENNPQHDAGVQNVEQAALNAVQAPPPPTNNFRGSGGSE